MAEEIRTWAGPREAGVDFLSAGRCGQGAEAINYGEEDGHREPGIMTEAEVHDGRRPADTAHAKTGATLVTAEAELPCAVLAEKAEDPVFGGGVDPLEAHVAYGFPLRSGWPHQLFLREPS